MVDVRHGDGESVPTHVEAMPARAVRATTDDALIATWLASKRPQTARVYGFAVRAFRSACPRPLRELKLEDLQEWVAGLEGKPATRALRVSAIKSLLSFAHTTGYTRFNVGAVVRPPRQHIRRADRILTEEEVFRLIAATRTTRDRALVTLLYYSGMRAEEASTLRWRDGVAREGEQLQWTVVGKGEYERVILTPPRVTRELDAAYPPEPSDGPLGRDPDQTVFLARGARPMSTRAIHNVVVQARTRAELDRAVTPHWLRHAFASHALSRGASLPLVQRDLGHRSATTTARYLHARPTESASSYLPE